MEDKAWDIVKEAAKYLQISNWIHEEWATTIYFYVQENSDNRNNQMSVVTSIRWCKATEKWFPSFEYPFHFSTLLFLIIIGTEKVINGHLLSVNYLDSTTPPFCISQHEWNTAYNTTCAYKFYTQCPVSCLHHATNVTRSRATKAANNVKGYIAAVAKITQSQGLYLFTVVPAQLKVQILIGFLYLFFWKIRLGRQYFFKYSFNDCQLHAINRH